MSAPISIENFTQALDWARKGVKPEDVAAALLKNMTGDERLWLLDGDMEFWTGFKDMFEGGYTSHCWPHGEVQRLGIPGFHFCDGPRGAVVGKSTAFPVSMARGATWDVSLEEKVGLAIGKEIRAQGGNLFGGVCINLPRHPAWGRVQEVYGEDPIILGEFGSALVRGTQRNVMATAKHFACNSMENARFSVDVTIDEAVFHEVYGAHFRRVVEEGVFAVMTSYNAVNGEWCGENEFIMETFLRDTYGFKGVTVSDFIWGLRDPVKSLRAGLDIEEPFRQQRGMTLPGALERGEVSWSYVDRAAKRILATQIRYMLARDVEEPRRDVVFCRDHRRLAREVAARSMVLLKNESVKGKLLLPLDAESISKAAVIGRLANQENTGDHGSSKINCPSVITPYEGIKSLLQKAEVVLAATDEIAEAVRVASSADVAIVVVGYTGKDEGEFIDGGIFKDKALLSLNPPPNDSEACTQVTAKFKRIQEQGSDGPNIIGGDATVGTGGDRKSLRLRPIDADIIRAVAQVNSRTIVTIITAGAVITEEWRHEVPAILISWYSGTEGGNALSDVLFGRVDASGRLPYSIPRDEQDLPFYDINAKSIVYDRWFGQRHLDHKKIEAAFPLGFGLSYTSFTFSELREEKVRGPEALNISVTVKNTGSREGRQVVQVYGKPEPALSDFPARVLLGFGVVDLKVGEAKVVTVEASTRPLKRWENGGFTFASPSATIEVGHYSGDLSAVSLNIDLLKPINCCKI